MTRLALASLVAAGLSGCVTMTPPEQPGQIGKAEISGKKTVGTMISVHAPAADSCTYNGAAELGVREGGFHDFLFVTGVWSNPATLQVECRTSDGKSLTRYLRAPFDEKQFRTDRTTSTVTSAILTGPLALITGPLVSEAMKNAYLRPPLLIHVPADEELATPAAKAAARDAAVKRWRELAASVKQACDPKTRKPKTMIGYGCADEFFAVMRDTDLGIFDGASDAAPVSAAAIQPATADAAAPTPAPATDAAS